MSYATIDLLGPQSKDGRLTELGQHVRMVYMMKLTIIADYFFYKTRLRVQPKHLYQPKW